MRAGAIRIVLASFVSLIAPATLHADPTVIGIWFSPFQPDEDGVMSLIEFRSDGTFREEFRKCDGGDYIGYQTEIGHLVGGGRRRAYHRRHDQWRSRHDIGRLQNCSPDGL